MCITRDYKNEKHDFGAENFRRRRCFAFLIIEHVVVVVVDCDVQQTDFPICLAKSPMIWLAKYTTHI